MITYQHDTKTKANMFHQYDCLVDSQFKGGHSEELTFFLSSPIASEHSPFPLMENSASEVPAFLKKFVSKEETSEAAILKLSWQPRRVYLSIS